MNLKFKFASLILNARLDKGLTQSETAEAVGISVRWVQRIESGQKLPGTLTLLRLIKLFNIDINELNEEVEIFDFVSSNTRKFVKSRK
ncbi:MAG: helix-turn-helix transcriptional regulator [Clostridia bacterium]|nr:helix-turn-helix transcriptional regulator [Clostridia bacterium]